MPNSLQTQYILEVLVIQAFATISSLWMLRIEPRTLYKLRKYSTNWAASQVWKLSNTIADIEIILKAEGSEVDNFVSIGLLPWR